MIDTRQAIRIEEASERLLANCKMVEEITILVNDSLHYTLAKDLYAPYANPAFRRSSYDGFAIRKEDDHSYPKRFKVVGEVPCGEVFTRRLDKNETVRIMTGAKLPDDADKVIMLEQSRLTGNENEVLLTESSISTNVIPIGADFTCGDKIVSKGHLINAGTISLLCSFGIEKVTVFRKPKVAVLSTGTELLEFGKSVQDGKIYDSNRPLIEQLLKENNCELVYSGNLIDDKISIEEKLFSLLSGVDVIVTIGGVSVGDFDFIAAIVKEHQFLFNKIQMRPGSPTSAAFLGDTLLMALSGNPKACFVGFHLFLKPYLRKLTKTTQTIKKTKAILQSNYHHTSTFERLLCAKYEFDETGQLCVTSVGSDRSSSLEHLHETNCLIKIPNGKHYKKQGDLVDVLIL